MRRWIRFSLLVFIATAGISLAQVTTSQYDNFRTGATLNERTLNPQNVNARQFGKIGAFKVDGPVYAQPLFLPGVEIPGKGTHDVIYVATEHDSVYAFDADTARRRKLGEEREQEAPRSGTQIEQPKTGVSIRDPSQHALDHRFGLGPRIQGVA